MATRYTLIRTALENAYQGTVFPVVIDYLVAEDLYVVRSPHHSLDKSATPHMLVLAPFAPVALNIGAIVDIKHLLCDAGATAPAPPKPGPRWQTVLSNARIMQEVVVINANGKVFKGRRVAPDRWQIENNNEWRAVGEGDYRIVGWRHLDFPGEDQ